jgi:hypothetical protein
MNGNCTATIKAEDTQKLDVTVNCVPNELLDSGKILGENTDFQLPANFNENPQPEYADAPGSSNMDIKTGGIIGLITILGSSPLFVELIRGVPVAELVNTAVRLIENNLWIIGIIVVAYLFRETIHGAMKQWTLGKVIDSKADPNKNSVEIRPR